MHWLIASIIFSLSESHLDKRMEGGPSDYQERSRRCNAIDREEINSDEFLTLKPTVLFGYADMLAIGWYVYH